MSADPEIKLRKLTAQTAAWLEAEWRKDPRRSKAEIVGAALHELACERIRDAQRLLGALGVVEGHGGPMRPFDGNKGRAE